MSYYQGKDGVFMMSKIEWNQNFSIAIEELDEEHQILINIVNQLCDAMRSKQSKSALPEILKKLREYIEFHHDHEETYMKNSKYPHFDKHHQDHLEFDATIQSLSKLHGIDLLHAKTLLNTLYDWIINHICQTDKEFCEFYHQAMKK